MYTAIKGTEETRGWGRRMEGTTEKDLERNVIQDESLSVLLF